MGGSAYLDEANEILESVKGKVLTVGERKRLAVELAALMLREASRTMSASGGSSGSPFSQPALPRSRRPCR